MDFFTSKSIENFEVSPNNSLSNSSLEKQIESDRQKLRNLSQSIGFYHSNIDRAKAEQLLTIQYRKTRSNGIFLLRNCTTSTADYGLSIIFNEKFYHYKVQRIYNNVFSIDSGPQIVGIENLIHYYQQRSDGLISVLSSEFVPGQSAPIDSRAFGITNILHRASQQGNIEIVNQIFSDQFDSIRADINDRNASGSTALHLASNFGHDKIVRTLLKNDADIRLRDINGCSPLHRSCAANHRSTMIVLLDMGGSDIEERNFINGWVPLHESAFHNAKDCVQELLDRGASLRPRTDQGKTPLQLAEENKAHEVIQILESYKTPSAKSHREDWLHDKANFDRFAAKSLIESVPLSRRQGVFLIRPSSKALQNFALTLFHKQEFYNFEISSTDEKTFFIDDGPFFDSLEHLVDHYSRISDGLPTSLKYSIDAHGSVKSMDVQSQRTKTSEQENPGGNGSDDSSKSKKNDQNQRTSRTRKSSISSKPDLNNSTATNNVVSSSSLSSSILSLNSSVCSSISRASSTASSLLSPSSSNISLESQIASKDKSSNQNQHVEDQTEDKTSYRLTFIPLVQIQKTEKLGEGEFGEVYKGFYFHNSTMLPVAIKHLKDYSQTAKIDFLREAEHMAKLNHRCICKLYGIVDTNSNDMMMVIEFLLLGSMLDYLWKYKNLLTEYRLRLWSSQIADGMSYMEQKGIVHRDLAARNILLQSTDQVKISDFGLSRCVDAAIYVQKSDSKIPVKWYAPEAISIGKFTSKSDVWSFGVTLWEMFSYGETPYGDMSGSDVYYSLQNGERLERPADCPSSIYSIMEKCWQWNENKRPTFVQLYQILKLDGGKLPLRRSSSSEKKSIKNVSSKNDLEGENFSLL